MAAAWGSTQPSPAIWALALVFLAGAWLRTTRSNAGVTPLAVAVWAYTGWTITDSVFLGDQYNPAGLFDPLFLLAGFSIGRALDRPQLTGAFGMAAAAIAALAGLDVLQVAFGWPRGQAIFETPNTLASVLNLALAPAATLILLGVKRRNLDLLAIGLFAGLWASQSRSAALALFAGIAIAMVIAKRYSLQVRGLARVIMLLMIGALIATAAMLLSNWLPLLGSPSSGPPTLSSLSSRFELYRLAWDSIHPPFCCGVGYLGFRFLLEIGRTSVPSYGADSITYFVHNDYLQVLLELGLPGFVALASTVVLPFILVIRHAPGNYDERCVLIAAIAALATTAVHAVMDFPLHVPICLLLFGMSIGCIERLVASPARVTARWSSAAGRMGQIVIGATLVTLGARPVIAEAAAAYGMHSWQQGDGRRAALGLELARRFDSRDWRYQLYVGQFWFAQATQTGTAQAAQRADDAFAAGIAANPFDTSNRLARLATHIRFRQLLSSPADSATLRAWADASLALAPANPRVRAEYEQLVHQIADKR